MAHNQSFHEKFSAFPPPPSPSSSSSSSTGTSSAVSDSSAPPVHDLLHENQIETDTTMPPKAAKSLPVLPPELWKTPSTTPSTSNLHLTQMPSEILLNIAEFLGQKFLHRLCNTSKRFQNTLTTKWYTWDHVKNGKKMGNKAWIRCVKHYQCPSKHSGASKKDSDLILQRLVSFVECASLDKTVKPGDVVNARFKYREWPDPEGFSRPTAEESLWEYECNALVYGCMEREETLVHWLLKQKGLDVMTVTREKGNTALTGAAFWYGWKEICAKILDRLREQCWEEAENEERERSHEPKENGGPEDLKIRPTTEEVAERKRLAHINTRNRPVGSTALYVTSYTSQSCPPTVQLLLKAGADHSIPTIDLPARRIQGETFDAIPAKTCLQAAADKHVFSKTSEAKKRDREVVRLLLEHGADRNMRYEYKHSPIDIARKAERDDIVSLLEKVQRTGVVPPFTGYRESRGSGRDRGRRTDEDEDDDESNERPPSPPDGISREYSNMDNTPTANFPRNGNTNANGRGIVVGRPIGQRKNQKEKKPAHKGPRNDNTRTNGNNVAAAMGRLALQGGTETRTMDSRDADDCSGGWTAGTRNPKSKSMQGITTDSTANTASENDTSTRGRGKKKRSKNRGRGNKNARHNDVDRDGGGEGSVQA